MHSVILVLAFGATLCLVYGLLGIITARRRQVIDRIEQYTKKIHQQNTSTKASKEQMSLKKTFQQMSQVFAAKSYTETVEKELVKADIPLRGEEFILLNFLATMGMAGLFFLFTQNFILGWVGAVAGFMIPRILVKRAKQKRTARFNSQIGDALVIMANSLRAGFSFLQAMELVSKEMSPPISTEFARTLREMNLGTPSEEALQNLAGRIESEDLDLVMTAVLIQRQVGGNLSQVLDSISHTIRERVRIKGEIKTLTAQGRISGMVIGALPLVLGVILGAINPSYMAVLFQESAGIALIVTGVILQLIGIALIKKIVEIKI